MAKGLSGHYKACQGKSAERDEDETALAVLALSASDAL
ncbi:hypothetical protein RR11_217 [Ruegeria sp. R11]|nr:hypothetical protein RR11_217 [Ruegeria sp. R11]